VYSNIYVKRRKSMRISQQSKKGFTLIELLVAMVILGILVAAGVPGLRTLMSNMAVRSTSDQLLNALAYARGEAVARVTNISVCASGNQTSCSGTWSDGWIVFVDNNGDGSVTAPADVVIKVEDNSANDTDIAGGTVTFDRLGENTGVARTFTVSLTGASSRTITVTNVGSIQ
jgi:type IV fimbrial biogenesis protein FimT